MCLEPGHNFRQRRWYWAWLVTPGRCNAASVKATLDTIPQGMDDHLEKYQEIMALARQLDLLLEESIQLGISIIAGTSDLEALRRFALRRERAKLAETLGHPSNWETMDMDELRNMVAAHQRGTATTSAPASGAGQNQDEPDWGGRGNTQDDATS